MGFTDIYGIIKQVINMKEIKMILTDLDGTLLNEDKQIGELTKEAIAKCKDKGIKFGIASGRPLDPILQFIKEWGVEDLPDFVLGMNGGVVYDTKTGYREEYHLLDGEIIIDIMNHFKELDVTFMLFDGNIRYVNRSTDETRASALIFGEIETLADLFELCRKRQFNKLIINCAPDYMSVVEKHAEAFKNEKCVAFKTAITLFEYVDPRINKSFGAQKMCEHFNISMENVMAFGDTSNDNEMIRDAGVGVWMCNGSDDTKALSNAIAKSNNEDGVGQFLFDNVLK